MDIKKYDKIFKIILYFFIYALLGWILETLYAIYDVGYFYKRGFLYGPICPIYGYGAIMLILFFSNFKKHTLKLFFYSGIVFSAFEYVVSYILEACFQMSWWDYTNDFLNLNGRISIFFSFAWGIIAILFIDRIHPFIEKHMEKLFNKFSVKTHFITSVCLICVLITDTVFSSIKYLT